MSKQLQTLRRRMEAHPDGKEQYESEAATLELTLDALKEKQEEYQDYLSDLAEQYCAYWNNAAAEQQADAAEDYAVDMAKWPAALCGAPSYLLPTRKSLWNTVKKCSRRRKASEPWYSGRRRRNTILYGRTRRRKHMRIPGKQRKTGK